MNKIQRVSRFFKVVFQLFSVLLPVFLLIGWYYAPAIHTMLVGFAEIDVIPLSYKKHILHTLTLNEKISGFLISLIPLLVQLYILNRLIKVFGLFEKGEIFSLKNVKYINSIGYAMLIGQLIINPIYQALMGIVLTFQNPVGSRFISITLNQTNVGILLTALLVILISWIMTEGYNLRQDQQLTI